MKRVIFTLIFFCGCLFVNAQQTYYWTGGTTGSWTAPSSWNTALNGSGTARASANNADVLIIDGSNIGGAAPATGTVTPDIPSSVTVAQFFIQNAATVVLQRSASGTSAFTINGDGTNADDFIIGTNCTLTIQTLTGFGTSLALGVPGTPATGTISGTLTINDGGSGTARLTVANSNSLFFAAGSIFNSNVSVASAYPFGSNSTSPAAASLGIVFQSGSTAILKGGNSIFGNTTSFNPVSFSKGSRLALEATQPTGLFGSRTLANVIIRNNVNITLAENFFNIDTLTVNAGSSFFLRTTGTAPISGNIINNGTFGSASGATSSHLILVGSVPQTISGSGSFPGFSAFSVGTDASVTINNNITIGSASGTPTSTITGRLNVQGFTINSTGTTTPGPISFRAAATGTSPGTLTSGSNTVTLNAANYSGSVNTANVVVGGLVTGAGIQPNTYVISTSSGSSTFTMSKPATATTTTDGASITITSNAATLTTSNAAGVDGSITTTGIRTFGSGTNYVFNAATTAPFSASTNNVTGDVTFNAACTTNKVQSIGGILTLGTGKLTIRNSDTLKLTAGNAIAGGSFGNTKYIVTETVGANTGVITLSNFSVARTLPIGSATNYLPITLTPTSTDAFAVGVFEGITTDGTSTGTAMSVAQKAKVVDAVWIVNRISSNTDNCSISLNWPNSLEGSTFSTYGNGIGIARNAASLWSTVAGSGDNTANTATNSFNAFGPLGVGQLGFILPVKLSNFSAINLQGKVKLQWTAEAETNLDSYIIEKSSDGYNFSFLQSISATNSKQYSGIDNMPSVNGYNYYRIKMAEKDGSFSYSVIAKIKLNSSQPLVSVYPNPIKGTQFYLQLADATKGLVAARMYNANGQLVHIATFNYEGGTQLQTINLPIGLAKGKYLLVVHNGSKQSLNTSIILQ
jgi:hypothetical protein